MDYRKTAQEIYDHIGKKENIISKTLPLIICKLIYVNPIIRKKRTLMIASEFLFHVQSYISVRLSEYHLTSHFYFFMYR